MNINTKYFGPVDCTEADFITFPRGLFGFEDETEFLLLPFSGSCGNLICFQSVRTPALAFVAMNPFSLDPAYDPQPQPEALSLLRTKDRQALSCYVLCAVREPVGSSTLNFRCPILLREGTRTAVQVILEDSALDMHRRLSDFSGGGAPC